MKVEEWPSWAKWGQAGPNGVKWGQMVPNGAKLWQMVPNGTNWAKLGQTGTNGALQSQTGPNGPNRAKFGWFFAYRNIFMRGKNHVEQPRPSRGFCWFLDFDWTPLKTWCVFLYLWDYFFIFLYCFILSRGSKFLGAPFMVKNWSLVNFKFFLFKAIFGHEGGTNKLYVVAQMNAIEMSFQRI